MMWSYHIPVLLAGYLWHVDYFTSFWKILLNFRTFFHPAPSSQFPWLTISNLKYLNQVHYVYGESNAVRYMDEFSMKVVVQTDSYWVLTALSVTCITSPTYMLLVFFVTNLAFPLSLSSNGQIQVKCVCRPTACFGFYNVRIVCSTLAHT
jgi:hypothetical protein